MESIIKAAPGSLAIVIVIPNEVRALLFGRFSNQAVLLASRRYDAGWSRLGWNWGTGDASLKGPLYRMPPTQAQK